MTREELISTYPDFEILQSIGADAQPNEPIPQRWQQEMRQGSNGLFPQLPMQIARDIRYLCWIIEEEILQEGE